MIRALAAAQKSRMAAAPRREIPSAATRRRAAPSKSPEAKTPSSAGDPGTLDKEYIRERVAEIVPLVKECYEETLREKPELEGKIVVRFTITGEPDIGGIIADSQVVEGTTIGDTLFRECVQETMYALLMRAPDRGGEVIVTYPFIFSVADP